MASEADLRTFVARQRDWLRRELQCEGDEGATEEGRAHAALHRLAVADVAVGLYGRTVLTLEAVAAAAAVSGGGAASPLLPAHRFTTGDEVEIRSKASQDSAVSSKKVPGGVISQVTETSVAVALFDGGLEGDSDLLAAPLSLLPKSSIEIHKKLLAALEELERRGADHPVAGAVVRAAFEAPSGEDAASVKNPIRPFSDRLERSQIDAIAFALTENRPMALIHGPPGTGKTTTVVELIRQAVLHHGHKVLVTAPSNVAVDNVLARLAAADAGGSGGGATGRRQSQKLRLVRLGHPARLQSSILPYSLEALVQGAEGTEIVADVRRELQSFLRIAGSPRSRAADRRLAYREIKALRQEVRAREEKVVQELLGQAQVVLATCVGASNRLLRDLRFDLVVVDEAAQALEAECWIPALRGARLVLAGDHCQLPPTIQCTDPDVAQGLGRTMFERVMELYGDHGGTSVDGRVSRMLQVQYRMHETISDWASQAMYKGRLQTHELVRRRTLSQLTGVSDEDGVSDTALLLIDTAGCHMHESRNAAGSRYNMGEADLVAHHVRTLVNDLKVRQEEIAVITPYNGQVEVLRTSLLGTFPKLEIRSVDGFQGGEREAVVLSLVRSSERGGDGGIGFLRDDRRLNVAITRAKRHCCVICDSETVGQSSFIRNLLTWIDEHGDPRSALDFMKEQDQGFQSDLADAEALLSEAMNITKKQSEKQIKVQLAAETTKRKQKDDELLAIVKCFAGSGKPGDSLSLSSELTSFDRMVVHEEAEKLGIVHRSEGEGEDRRIVLSIQQLGDAGTDENQKVARNTTTAVLEEGRLSPPVESDYSVKRMDAFAAVAYEDDEEAEEEEDTLPEPSPASVAVVGQDPILETAEPSMNRLLNELAVERKARERQLQAAGRTNGPAASKPAKKKNGQTLGGSKKPTNDHQLALNDKRYDDLDDMAFLDAQIDLVQNSHGRMIDAKGSNYRTVINGILISKPKPEEKKKDPNKAASLQKKLNQAQADRRAKVKK